MRRRGGVFILTLVVLTAATTILALTMAAHRVDFRSTLNRMEGKRARLMAEAGLQRAMAELALLEQTSSVSQTGSWHLLGDTGAERFMVGGGSCRLQIVDAGSLISLNTASETTLQNLGLSQTQIDCLLDWREPGEEPRPDGAKDEYYNGLEKPYNASKGRLQSVDEALLIRDWLPTTLYEVQNSTGNSVATRPLIEMVTVDSFSPNVDSTGAQRGNINNVQAQQLVQAGLTQQQAQAVIARRTGLGRFNGMNQVFTTPGLDTRSAEILLDRYSAVGGGRLEGRVNVNTATEDVLASLPGMSTDIAQGIVSRQASGFASLGELTQVPGVTLQLLSQMADEVTVGSDTFLVRSEGTAGRTRVCLETVVRVDNGNVIVLKTTEPHLTDMSTVWQWSTESQSETVLGEDRRQ